MRIVPKDNTKCKMIGSHFVFSIAKDVLTNEFTSFKFTHDITEDNFIGNSNVLSANSSILVTYFFNDM